jgi:HK97 gp10 family phage protein
MPRITGAKQVSSKLRRLGGREKIEFMGKALYAAGDEIRAHAAHSITAGSVSGALHVPSLPGEPPNADTHILDRSIEVAQTAPLRVEVSSNAPYSAALEYGTSKMAERPFMRPAVKAKRQRVTELVGKAVNIVVKRK